MFSDGLGQWSVGLDNAFPVTVFTFPVDSALGDDFLEAFDFFFTVVAEIARQALAVLDFTLEFDNTATFLTLTFFRATNMSLAARRALIDFVMSSQENYLTAFSAATGTGREMGIQAFFRVKLHLW